MSETVGIGVLAELGHSRHAQGASAESGASAPTPRTRAADLSLSNLQRSIETRSWFENQYADFDVGVARPYHRWTEAPEDSEYFLRSASRNSSMAVSIPVADVASFRHSVASSRGSVPYPPSFGPCSTVKSESSVRTSYVESSIERYGLEVDENGVFVAPVQATHEGHWACLFDFLDCRLRFSNPEQWDTHCKSHLRGHLPCKLECPFSCQWKTTASSGEEAWAQRALHIIAEHSREERDRSTRPALSLLDHMLRFDVIDRATYKELRQYGRVREGFVFTTSSGPMQDRRRERHERGLAHRR